MNEVEKMYENTGIETEIEIVPRYSLNCEYFEVRKVCPPFTAEKQILLIQWLLDKTDLYLHRHKTDFTYSIATGDIAVNKYKCFKESLANLINTIWQDLTEQERKQIKDILE